MKWHRVAGLLPACMATQPKLCYKPNARAMLPGEWQPYFAEDRAALLDLFADLAL